MAAKGKTRVVDHGWNKVAAAMQDNKRGARVVVGILANQKNQRKGDPLTNAVLGFIHEFGSADGHVPERSFIRATIDENAHKYKEFIARVAGLVLLGKMSEHQALELVGLKVQGDVVRRINAGIPPPLAASTLRRKTVNGLVGTTPLVETGQLKSAITFEVRDAGKGGEHEQEAGTGAARPSRAPAHRSGPSRARGRGTATGKRE